MKEEEVCNYELKAREIRLRKTGGGLNFGYLLKTQSLFINVNDNDLAFYFFTWLCTKYKAI